MWTSPLFAYRVSACTPTERALGRPGASTAARAGRTFDRSAVDRLSVRELDLVPVRILDDAEVADDRAGVRRLDPEDAVGACGGRRGVHLLARRDGKAEVLQVPRAPIRGHREEDDHEIRVLRALREPDDPHPVVDPLVDDVEADVLPVKGD